MSSTEESILKLKTLHEKIDHRVDVISKHLVTLLGMEQNPQILDNLEDLKKIDQSNQALKKELGILIASRLFTAGSSTSQLAELLTKARHDMRNPLNVIKGFSEMLLEDFQSKDEASQLSAIIGEMVGVTNEIQVLISDLKIPSSPLTVFKHVTTDLAHHHETSVTLKKGDDEKEFLVFKEKYPILIVDDVEGNCSLLEKYLNKIGFKNIQSVNDGFEALEIAKRFELILLDIDMPGMSGIEVLKALKDEIVHKRLMILMISGADTMENVLECIKLGAEDFLTKPFNPEMLQVRVGSCVEKSWSTHQEHILHRKLEHEKQRYSLLLHSIFPPVIVNELAETGHIETRNYENVAILFTDVVSFTTYCDTHTLDEIVNSIQEFAAMCEVVAAQFKLQKIKTIGDAFLGVAGMLIESENPVLDCIRCGQEFIRQTEHLSSKWKLHVGINLGTVIGGIVGKSQYLFDVWGDTVNTAARLESIAEPNTIYLSKHAWDQVNQICKGHSLGELPIKGKSPLEVFKYDGML